MNPAELLVLYPLIGCRMLNVSNLELRIQEVNDNITRTATPRLPRPIWAIHGKITFVFWNEAIPSRGSYSQLWLYSLAGGRCKQTTISNPLTICHLNDLQLTDAWLNRPVLRHILSTRASYREVLWTPFCLTSTVCWSHELFRTGAQSLRGINTWPKCSTIISFNGLIQAKYTTL